MTLRVKRSAYQEMQAWAFKRRAAAERVLQTSAALTSVMEQANFARIDGMAKLTIRQSYRLSLSKIDLRM
ncbi:MAG TPA: hypothetical protein VIL09_12730 [Microvirga sp.]|jgi:hypothetical protein